MLFVIVTVVGLAGCGAGSAGDEEDPTPTPAPTEVSQVPEEDDANPAPNVPPGATAAPAPTSRPSSYDADGDGLLTADELKAAIIGTFGEFQFPAEYPITGEQLADQVLGSFSANDRATAMWEAGGEYMFVGSYHQCAWERVYLQANASGETRRQDEALDMLLATLPKLPMDDQGREIYEDFYAKARLGDPSGVARDVDGNCIGIAELTPVPGTP